MAITKVSQYNSTPTAVSDYQAQNAHLQAFINQLNGSVSVLNQSATTVIPTIKQGSYISMGGTAYIVDTEDYTILGSLSSGLNYIKLAVSGDNLTATWTNSLSGYSWNPIYNYYTYGSYALLPYVVNYVSGNYYISQFDRTFNQGLKTTDNVEFGKITTGSYGDITLGDNGTITTGSYGDITLGNNGKIKTSDSGTITTGYGGKITTGSYGDIITGPYGNIATGYSGDITLGGDGHLFPTNSPTSGTQSLDTDDTWTPARGVYTYAVTAGQIYISVDSGTTYSLSRNSYGGTLFADGTKVKIKAYSDGTTIKYLKF